MGLSAARPMIPLFEYDADDAGNEDGMDGDADEAATAVGRPAAAAVDDRGRDQEAQLAPEGEGGGSSPLEGAESRAPAGTETWPCDGEAPPRFSAVGGLDGVIGDEMDATSSSARATTLFLSEESGSINSEPRGLSRFPYDLEHAPAPDATDGHDFCGGFTTASAAAASAGTHRASDRAGAYEGASGTPGTLQALVHRKTSSHPDQGRAATHGLGHDWLRRVLDFLRKQSTIRRLTCQADDHEDDDQDDERTVVVHYYCQLSLPDADGEAAAVDAALGMPSSPRRQRQRKKCRVRAVLHVEPVPGGGPTCADVVVVTARDLAFGSVLTVVGSPEMAAPTFGGPVLCPVRAAEAATRAPTPSFHSEPPSEPDPGGQDSNATVPMASDPAAVPEAGSSAAARPTPQTVVQPSRSEPVLGTCPGRGGLGMTPTDRGPQDESTSPAEHRWVPWVPHRPSCDMDATHHHLPGCASTGIVDSNAGRWPDATLPIAAGSPRPRCSKTPVAEALGTSPDVPAEGIEDPVPIRDAPSSTDSSSLVPSSKAMEPSVASSLSTSTPKAIRKGSRSLPGEQPPGPGVEITEKEELRDSGPKTSFVMPIAAAGPSFGPSPVRREELEAVASPRPGQETVEEAPKRPADSEGVKSPATGPAAARTDYGSSPRFPAAERSVSAREEEEDFSFPSPDPPTPSPKGKDDDYDDWVMYSSVPFRRNFGVNDESPTFPSPDPPTPPERTDVEALAWESMMEASSPRLDVPGYASPTAQNGLQPEGVADDLGDEPHESPKADLGVPRHSPKGNPIGGSPRRTTTLQSNSAREDDDPTFSSRIPSAPRNDDAADQGLDLARRGDKKHKKKKKSKKHKRKRSSSDDPHSPRGELLKPPPPSALERTDETSRVGCQESQLALASTSRVRTEPVMDIHDPLVQPRDASRTMNQGVGFREVAGSVQRVAKRTSEVETEPNTLKGILRTEHTRISLSNEASRITVKDGSAACELEDRGSLTGGSGSPRNTVAPSDKTTIEAAEPLSSSITIAGQAKQESVHEECRLTGRGAATRGLLTHQVGFPATGGREDEIVPKNSPKRMRLDQGPDLPQQNRGLPIGWGSTRHFRANIRFDQYRKSAPSSLVAQDKRPEVHPESGKAYSRRLNPTSTLESVESVRKSCSVFNVTTSIRGRQIPERSVPLAGQATASLGSGPEQSHHQKWKVTPHLPYPLSQSADVEPTQGSFHESAGAGPQNSQRQMWEVTHHLPNPIIQSADMKRAQGRLRESAGDGPENVQGRNVTHRNPLPIHPKQPEQETMKNALGPLQQGPAPVRALCSEGFLSTWGDVAAELGSGRWATPLNANARANGADPSTGRRIELIDTCLVDQCAVDIEINDWGILLFTASALQTSDDAKMVVLSVARLVVLGRYRRLVIFLSYDVPITDSIARHIVQLQTAALCNGLKFPTETFFKTTSPRALSAAIAATVFSKVDARHLPHIDNATHPSYRLWAGFLLAICPKLCASGALKLLQLSQQVAPPNVNPLTFALKSEHFRRNIQDAVRTKSPTVSSIHPEAMPFLEKALLAPLKQR